MWCILLLLLFTTNWKWTLSVYMVVFPSSEWEVHHIHLDHMNAALLPIIITSLNGPFKVGPWSVDLERFYCIRNLHMRDSETRIRNQRIHLNCFLQNIFYFCAFQLVLGFDIVKSIILVYIYALYIAHMCVYIHYIYTWPQVWSWK